MNTKKNIVSNLLLTASTVIFPLLTFPYITRTLSSESYGKITFIESFAQYFVLISSLGIPYYGIREIAKMKNNILDRNQLVKELVTIQFLLSILCSVVFVIIYLSVDSLKFDLDLVSISCLYIVSSSFLIEWFYQGIEEFAFITKRSIAVKIMSLIIIFVFVKSENDKIFYFVAIAAIPLLNALVNFMYFIKTDNTRQESLKIRKHIRPLMLLFSINISISVYTILDVIILGFTRGPMDVGMYNVPLKIVKTFWMVLSSFGTVLVPRISNLISINDEASVKELLVKSSNIILMLSIPFWFFCFLFSEEILFIVAGAKYLDAVLALQILSIVPLIIGICNVFGTQLMLPAGKERYILNATVIGMVVSIFINLILTRQLGYTGTAISCVISESVVLIYIYIKSRNIIKISFDLQIVKLVMVSLVSTWLFYILLKNYVDNKFFILSLSLPFYLIVFVLFQIFVFNHEFVQSLLVFILNKVGAIFKVYENIFRYISSRSLTSFKK